MKKQSNSAEHLVIRVANIDLIIRSSVRCSVNFSANVLEQSTITKMDFGAELLTLCFGTKEINPHCFSKNLNKYCSNITPLYKNLMP